MKLKSATPKRFVTEGVEPKCRSAVGQQLIRVRDDLQIKVSEFSPCGVTLSWRALRVH
jgi:hypothetical protein